MLNTHSSMDDEVKEAVRQAADIVAVIGEQVALKRSGQSFLGLCPFHGEKSPSFFVHPQRQFFHCFGCGASGDVFSFVMRHHHLEFPEALKLLARKYQISMPERRLSEAEQAQLRLRDSLYAANEAAAQVYQHLLADELLGKQARAYLQRRGLSHEMQARYRLGYAPAPESRGWDFLIRELAPQTPVTVLEQAGLASPRARGGYYDRFRGRIMFPLVDMTGRVAAFGGRVLDDAQPKYMNSPESPIFDKSRLLFGLYPHREHIRRRKQALVVEGNFDLLLLAAHGVEHVVAPLGTALSRHHLRSLRGYCQEAVLLFDADAAGLKAAMRSIPFFLAEQVQGRVVLLPSGHDPDSFVREQGAQALEALIAEARPLAEFALSSLIREHGLSLSGKARIIEELKPLVQEAVDASQRALMIAHFTQALGVPSGYFGAVGAVAAQMRPPQSPPQRQQGSVFGAVGRQEKQLLDFLLFHPECLEALQAAGLSELPLHPAAQGLMRHMRECFCSPAPRPEDLLAAPLNAEERAYVIERLTQQAIYDDEEEASVQAMCQELIGWMSQQRQRRVAQQVQERIREVEPLGDRAELFDLLRHKQEHEKKHRGG